MAGHRRLAPGTNDDHALRHRSLGATAADCAHPGSAAFAVPDLIEEIAVSTLHDGGEVQAVPNPPGGIAAYLRFPLSRRDRT